VDRIAIVGAGLAGYSAAQELRRLGYSRDLVIVGDERHGPYRRPPLSKQLLEGAEVDTMLPHEQVAASWQLGRPATGLDVRTRRVLRGRGTPIEFDGLVIATGARARTLPEMPSLAGIATLRTLDDAHALRATLSEGPRTVVAGAGLLGSEIASVLRGRGIDVTVVERDVLPLRRTLGASLGRWVADLHRRHGVDLRLGRSVTAVTGGDRLRAVRLDDGTSLPADLLVVALGAVPATAWLAGTPILADDGGVLVDEHGSVAPGVVAAGDVTRWRHPVLGTLVRAEHYSNAVDQGVRAARTLLAADPPRPAVPSYWSTFYGRRIQAVGFTGADFDMDLVEGTLAGDFLAEYSYAGRVVGAVTVGHVRRLPEYRSLIAQEVA